MKNICGESIESCKSCEVYLAKIDALEREIEILINNMTCLYKTAQDEIKRKDRKIDNLNKLIFRKEKEIS